MVTREDIGYRGYETHRTWKHLGAVVMGMDIVYKIDGVHGDYDFDRESEIRALARQLVQEINAAGMAITEGSVAVKQDFPSRGRNLVLGFTSSDPDILVHMTPNRYLVPAGN